MTEILLVEDNPSDVELTLHFLRKFNLGNNVHIVRDGAEALEFLFCTGTYAKRRIEDHPKIVMLGLRLPKVDGLEVLQRIKADPRSREIQVVMLISSAMERDMMEKQRLGVNSYIIKPVDFSQLAETVKELGLYWVLVAQPPE